MAGRIAHECKANLRIVNLACERGLFPIVQVSLRIDELIVLIYQYNLFSFGFHWRHLQRPA